jgi:multicomponent Na+:H+ antiporter subunit F
MSVALAVIYFATGLLFTAAALLAVARIVRGPSILDRVIASDVLLTTLLLVIGAEMVINHHTRTIPLMVVLAATAVFGTIAVARYVSKQDHPAQGGGANPDGPDGADQELDDAAKNVDARGDTIVDDVAEAAVEAPETERADDK